jgi:hypothetical protein
MRLNNVHLIHLRAEEWLSLYTDFLELVPAYGTANLGITGLLARLVPLHQRAGKTMDVLRKSANTSQMKQMDKKRDACFRGLREIARASRHLLDEEDVQAAGRLFILFSSYSRTALNSSYAEKSAALYHLLQTLRNEYAGEVDRLGLGKWVENLNLVEQRFLAYRAERTQEDLQKPVEHLRLLRKETDAVYRSILELLYARLVADGLGGEVVVDPDSLKTGIYESDVPDEQRGNVTYNFVIAWNRSLKKYSDMLAAREGRSAKDRETETGMEAPD